VYAGVDPVTGHRHNLTETILAGPKAGVQAEPWSTPSGPPPVPTSDYARKNIRPLLGVPDFASE
jgi:hypothetical protein